MQVIGDRVNLAARLMAAAGPDEVLVDFATMEATEKNIVYEVLYLCAVWRADDCRSGSPCA